MPTVLRIGNFAFRLYPNEHLPPHIHVVTQEGEARIQLYPEVVLLGVHNLKKPEAIRMLKLARQYQEFLLGAWRDLRDKQEG